MKILRPGDRKKTFYILLLSMVGIILVAIFFDRVLMPWYVRSDAVRTVPDVIGLEYQDAVVKLERGGFKPHKSDERFDHRYPRGTVMQQNPQPEMNVKPGRRVYLIVSSGEQKVEVPSVRGRSLREARFTLERYGLTIGEIEYQFSTLYPENTIVEQGVPAGSEITRGSEISLIVSQGSDADRVMVPDVVGKSLTEAMRLLNQRGLKTGNITFQPISELLPNTVVQQYPHPGDRIPRTQPVDLFISEEPPAESQEIKEGGGGYEPE